MDQTFGRCGAKTCVAFLTNEKFITFPVIANLKESVDKVLKSVAIDVRDGIEAKPAPKVAEPESDSQESQAQPAVDPNEHDGQCLAFIPII
jgi:hypothetical protein